MPKTEPHSPLRLLQLVSSVLDHTVRHFREVLFWPVQLMPLGEHAGAQVQWEVLAQLTANNPWSLLPERFSENSEFDERHYKEFVTFLPYVQRCFYGESYSSLSHRADDPPGKSAIKVFQREDVAALQLVLYDNQSPLILKVEKVQLWFFDDIHIVFLKVELSADNIPFSTACDLLYRFGRAYPTGWDKSGQGKHNARSAAWLDQEGRVLASSDTADRDKFISYTHQHRSPGIAAHWDFLLRPMVLDPSEQQGELRYQQIEYHRMPLMAFLAVDEPRQISREQWLRLGFAASLHPDENLPASDPDVTDFESRYCYDRFWTGTEQGPNTRFICTGRAFIMLGDAHADYFRDPKRGILAQFRHQYALLFLLTHFHRASLLVFSGRMVDAIHDLDIRSALSISRFRRRIYASFEAFLRFTHRYWFHEISERTHVQALYQLTSKHLNNDALYRDVKDELQNMSQYLDSNSQRQQSTTVVRLTVVTVFSMLCTIVSGLLGMNIIDETNAPWSERLLYLFGTGLVVFLFVLAAILKSKSLSDVMDVLADDQKSLRVRLSALGRAWRRK